MIKISIVTICWVGLIGNNTLSSFCWGSVLGPCASGSLCYDWSHWRILNIDIALCIIYLQGRGPLLHPVVSCRQIPNQGPVYCHFLFLSLPIYKLCFVHLGCLLLILLWFLLPTFCLFLTWFRITCCISLSAVSLLGLDFDTSHGFSCRLLPLICWLLGLVLDYSHSTVYCILLPGSWLWLQITVNSPILFTLWFGLFALCRGFSILLKYSNLSLHLTQT